MGTGDPLIDSILGSIIGGLILISILRYWRYRTIKGIKRRIRSAEEYKLILESVAESERSILLFSFRRLFACLALILFIFVLKNYLSLLELFLPIKYNPKLLYFLIFALGF